VSPPATDVPERLSVKEVEGPPLVGADTAVPAVGLPEQTFTPVALTATLAVAALPPAIVIVPDIAPSAVGQARTNIVCAESADVAYASDNEENQSVPSIDTWKFAGAVSVSEPGAPVRFAPETVNEVTPAHEPVVTPQ